MPKPDLSKLSAAEIDALIVEAAKLRATLQPPIAGEAPVTAKTPQQFEAVLRPAWYTFANEHGTVIQIRHPGHGWLTFVIPPNDRAQLLGLLLNQALFVPPTGTSGALAAPAAGGSLLH